MYTTLFLMQAGIQFLLLLWLVRVYRATGLAIALAMIIPQFGLFYDNLIVGLGRFIGIGGFLEALSWPRFWIHWLFGAWMIIASGAILRLAGFGWAKNKAVMAGFCLVTVALMVHDLPYFWTTALYPVCEFDLVRYSTQVDASRFCSPDQVVVVGDGPPIAPIMTCFVVILSGLVLWVKRGFPWVFAGSLLMLITATPFFSRYKLDNFGEILIAGGIIWGIAHFSGRRRAWLARSA